MGGGGGRPPPNAMVDPPLEETALKLARKAKRDPFSFRRKGNENQFRFCEDVEEQLQSAASSISRAEKAAGKEALSRAKNAVEQGMELLSRRKKLIKLADRSEAGWALVEEYVEDDLAEDSEDERRIEKAERAAERKIAKSGTPPRRGRRRGIMSGQSRCFPTASACTRQKSLPHWYHSRGPHQEPATNVANSAIGGVNALNVWPQVQRFLYYM